MSRCLGPKRVVCFFPVRIAEKLSAMTGRVHAVPSLSSVNPRMTTTDFGAATDFSGTKMTRTG